MSEFHSLPFHILQEENLWILVHKNRPSWVVTNEVGRDIAVRNFLKSSKEEIAEFLKNRYGPSENIEEDIQEFLRELEDTGFLKEEFSDETHESGNTLKGILFLITQACNLDCHHCSLGSTPATKDFPKDFFQRIIEELASLQVNSLLLSGGEPLLRSDLFDLISFASQKLNVSLSTNGTLIGPKEAQKLKKASIAEIAISLDGISPRTHDDLRGKNNFQRVLKGIDSLLREGLGEKINLHFCLSRQNIDEAIDFPGFAENLGIRKITYLSMKKLGKASDYWRDLKPEREKYSEFLFKLYETFFKQGFPIQVNSPLSGFRPLTKPQERISTCPFGTQLIVNTNGDIYSCPGMFFPDYCLGNVFEMSIEDAMRSPKFKALKDDYRARRERIVKCKDCTWRNFCQAGCTSAVYTEKGTIWETDDFCDIRDKLYRKAILSAAQRKLSRREEVHVCAL